MSEPNELHEAIIEALAKGYSVNFKRWLNSYYIQVSNGSHTVRRALATAEFGKALPELEGPIPVIDQMASVVDQAVEELERKPYEPRYPPFKDQYEKCSKYGYFTWSTQ